MLFLEMIKVIALLCQVNTGIQGAFRYSYAEKEQLKCQKEYIKCVDTSLNKHTIIGEQYIGSVLKDCIKNRNIEGEY